MNTKLPKLLDSKQEAEQAGQLPADRVSPYLKSRIENKPVPTFIGRPDPMGRALMRGTDNLQATGFATAQVLGEAFGSEAVEEWGKSGVEKNIREAAMNPAEIQSTDDIESLGNLGTFIMESFGEALPGIGAMVASGGAAGLTARAALGKAVSRQISKAAMNATVKKATTAGALAGSLPQLAGETKMSTPEASPMEVFGTALAKAALELGPVGRVVGRVFQRTELPTSIGKILKQAPQDIAGLGMAEGLVEGSQQFLDQALNTYVNDAELFNDENWNEIFESAARGAAAGGVMGGISVPLTGIARQREGDLRQPEEDDSTGNNNRSLLPKTDDPGTGPFSGVQEDEYQERGPGLKPPPGVSQSNTFDGEFSRVEEGEYQGRAPGLNPPPVNSQTNTFDGEFSRVQEGEYQGRGPGLKPPPVSNQTNTFDGEYQNVDLVNPDSADAPMPSTPMENEFSADAFLEQRQQAYIQTPGEETPPAIQQAIENKQVVEQEITESADPQLVGSKIYTRPNDAVAAMDKIRKRGGGELQGYGVDNKPALEDVKQVFIPVDSKGRQGSPVLATDNVQEQDRIKTALRDRVGPEGTVLQREATPEFLNSIVKERQAQNSALKARRAMFQQPVSQPENTETDFQFIGTDNVRATARGADYSSKDRHTETQPFANREEAQQVADALKQSNPDRSFEAVEVDGRNFVTVTEQPDTVNSQTPTENNEAMYFGDSEVFNDPDYVNSRQYKAFSPSESRRVSESEPFDTLEEAQQQADFFGRMEPKNKFSIVGNETDGFFVEVIPLRNEFSGQERVRSNRPLSNQERAKAANDMDTSRQEDEFVEELGRYEGEESVDSDYEPTVIETAYRRAKRKVGKSDKDPRADKESDKFFRFEDKNGDIQSVNILQLTEAAAKLVDEKSINKLRKEDRLRSGFASVVDYIASQAKNPKRTARELTESNVQIGRREVKGKIYPIYMNPYHRERKDGEPTATEKARKRRIGDLKRQIAEYPSLAEVMIEDVSLRDKDGDLILSEGDIMPFLEYYIANDDKALRKYETLAESIANDTFEAKKNEPEPVVSEPRELLTEKVIDIQLDKATRKFKKFGTHRVSQDLPEALGEFLNETFKRLGLNGSMRIITPQEGEQLRGLNKEFDAALDSMKKGSSNQGAFIPMGETAIVIIKPNMPKAKAVMTLGHELGHMVYQKFLKDFAQNNNPAYQKMVDEYKTLLNQKRIEKGFEEWVSDKIAAGLRDLNTNPEFGPLRQALNRLIRYLQKVLPDRFSRSVPVDRFLKYVIKNSRAAKNPHLYFGYGAHKNMSMDTLTKRLKRFRRSVTAEKLNKVYGEASVFVGFVDSFNRRIVGDRFANIFKTRSQSNDRVRTTTHRVARKQFTPGMNVKSGELFWHNGNIYTAVVDGILEKTVSESLNKAQVAKVSRRELQQRHTENTGWLDAKNHQFAMWSRAFTDLMPKDHNKWDEWLDVHVVNPSSPDAQFKDVMDRFWVYMNERMGGKLGRLEDYRLPRVYDVDVIQQDPEAFKQVLRDNLLDPNGNPLSSAKMDDVVDAITNSILENNGVDVGAIFQDATVQSVGFNKKSRSLTDVPDRVLEPFMAPPKTRLLQYIKAGTSRAELESRAGGYSDINVLYEKLKRERGRGQHVDQDYFTAIHNIQKDYMEKARPWLKRFADLHARRTDILTDMDIETDAAALDKLQKRLDNVNEQLSKHEKVKPSSPQYWDPMKKVDLSIDALDPERRGQVRKVVDGMLGRAGLDMPVPARKVQQYLMTLQYMTTLMFAVPASLSDFGNIMVRTKEFSELGTNLKRLVQSARDYKELESLARSMGLAQHDAVINIILSSYGDMYMDPKVQKMNETFFKLTGLEWYTKTTRIVAMNLGMGFIEDHMTRALKGDSRSRRYLKELGLTPGDVQAWVDAGKPMQSVSSDSDNRINKVLRGIDQFVNESVLRPDAAQRPSWANDMRFQLVWQLKSFFYAFGHNILGGIYREMESRYKESGGKLDMNTIAPAMLGAVTLMPLASVGLSIREGIKYGFEEDPTENTGFWEYMYEVFDRAGGLGPFSLVQGMFDAENFGGSGVVSLLGPTAAHAETFLKGGFGAGLKRAIPIHNQLNGQAFGMDYLPGE